MIVLTYWVSWPPQEVDYIGCTFLLIIATNMGYYYCLTDY